MGRQHPVSWAQAQRANAHRSRTNRTQQEWSSQTQISLELSRLWRLFPTLPAHEVTIKDTAGSGDWTTMGLLSALFRNGTPNLAAASRQDIAAGIDHGQALAALNCKFEGARGAMYKLTRPAFLEAVRTIEEKRPSAPRERKISLSQDMTASLVCPSCSPKNSRADHQSTKARAVRLV